MATERDVTAYFGNTVDRDVLSMLAGPVIGSGTARVVYECPLRPDLVVKIETFAKSFQNIMEWETWQWFKDENPARWLAPCEVISPCGSVLLMKRTTVPSPGQYPRRLPTFLTDTKRSNYGMLGRRLVCHDYGRLILTLPMRDRNVEWWNN